VDFVILADHGSPNPVAGNLRRTVDGVHFVGGSETNHPDGHLLVAGLDRIPRHLLPPFPPDVVHDVRRLGGFTVLIYPEWIKYRWQYWDADFQPEGIEVLNLFSSLRQAGLEQKVDVFLTAPFGDFNILKSLRRPAAELRRWDELLQRAMTFGFYGLDLHGGFRIARTVPVPVPSYRMGFGLLALGIDAVAADDPLAAVRRGEFFSVVRGAAEPEHFTFGARQGEQVIPAGRLLTGRADLAASVQVAGYRTRIVLYRDGRPFRQADAERLDLPNAPAGMYRVEIHLLDHPYLSPEVPWISSNPIGIDRCPAAAPAAGPATPSGILKSIDHLRFRVESDPVSQARYAPVAGDGLFEYTLARPNPPEAGRWCALALREPMDIAGGLGVYIRAESDPEMRYYVELRRGDRWYYASFAAGPGGFERPCVVPFRNFYRVDGGREPVAETVFDGMFISVSNRNARPGFSGRLRIREIGFYR
jgi:hypothetical protein